jgi:RNA polymerase sigma-70 factor (ECF subfamily)
MISNPNDNRLDPRCFQTHRPLVYSVCRRYFRRRQDAEDATQETFLKLLMHRDKVCGPRVAGWLSATAHSTCVDLIRKQAGERRRIERLAHLGLPDPAVSAEREEAVQRVYRGLADVDGRSRDMLIERYYHRTPLRVIAVRNGVTVSTVSRWGSAAVAVLARSIKTRERAGRAT